ncbi:MAG: PhzF family phenazine biosynthesis protein [Parvularculaceae bacterium]|nr:PhzF family phenazine biosynthesis protein [Parvularculaceae bacterium]
MTEYPYTVVDAFTDKPFAGNPAAVMVVDEFFSDEMLLKIAIEHNLSETAFLVRLAEDHYRLRWFTPGAEVPLCGHATLASGAALFEEYGVQADEIRFETLSGTLTVAKTADGYRLDLPANMPAPIAEPPSLVDAIGMEADSVWDGQFWLALLPSEEAVRSVVPNFAAIEALPVPELGITAKGAYTDFVSRLFAPKIGIPEDPFTGSLHAMLVPFWAERLGKTRLSAHQASDRGGDALCELSGDRVLLFGNAVVTMRGKMAF